MKKYSALFLTTVMVISGACTKEQAPAIDSFGVSMESTGVLEYERPVIDVTVGGELRTFYYPGQVVVDGTPACTAINAAVTTIYAGRTNTIALPRLTPGDHIVELVVGKARSLYRDAEAACGENEKAFSLNVTVNPSDKVVFVLAKPRTDIDDYVFIPEDGYAYDALARSTEDVAVRAAWYSLQVYPTGLQAEGVTVSNIGSSLSVERRATAFSDGIEIKAVETLKKGDPASQFTLSAGGKDITVQVL